MKKKFNFYALLILAPERLCEFHSISGKILKTVDAVFQDVKTLDECRKKCLGAEYRCQSFDLGDPTNSVCRLSHLSSSSLAHIKDPYLAIPGASTYEISSCYNGKFTMKMSVVSNYIHLTQIGMRYWYNIWTEKISFGSV